MTLTWRTIDVDAPIGYGLTGDPRGGGRVIERANAAAPILALDTPSASTRRPAPRSPSASATLTLAAKTGLLALSAIFRRRPVSADIGVPPNCIGDWADPASSPTYDHSHHKEKFMEQKKSDQIVVYSTVWCQTQRAAILRRAACPRQRGHRAGRRGDGIRRRVNSGKRTIPTIVFRRLDAG
jgi:hypothetical protein